MSAPIPTPAEAEAALRDAKLKAACGLEYAVNLMNDTLTDPTTPLRVVGEIYDRFSKLVGVEKQQEQRGAGFKLVINLNSSTQTLQNTEVDPEAVALQAKAKLVEVRGRTMVLGDKKSAPSATPAKKPATRTARETGKLNRAKK